MKLSTLIALAALILAASPAEARKHHHRHAIYAVSQDCNVLWPCEGLFNGSERAVQRVSHRAQRHAGIVPHPAGCPARAFCGCGAAVRVFGSPIRSLWLAANWFKFPRAAPAPGMVAVRSHHVFVLEHQASRGSWVVYDANSGGHATRIHERSLAGYTIVNPRA